MMVRSRSVIAASLVAACAAAIVSYAQQWPPPQPGGAPPVADPPTTYLPSPQRGAFTDAFGRFRISLPSGSEQVNAVYNFAVPAESLQINVSVATRDEMFQYSLQNFPEMMRRSGASNVGEQQFDLRGRKATSVLVYMKDPQSNTSMESLNVFVPGPNVWLQVLGPMQNSQGVESTMQALLNTLETQ
jgi:hypothetical protein